MYWLSPIGPWRTCGNTRLDGPEGTFTALTNDREGATRKSLTCAAATAGAPEDILACVTDDQSSGVNKAVAAALKAPFGGSTRTTGSATRRPLTLYSLTRIVVAR